MPDIEFIRGEIERMRLQVHRQRGEIRQLQRAGISTTSAEALLAQLAQLEARFRYFRGFCTA